MIILHGTFIVVYMVQSSVSSVPSVAILYPLFYVKDEAINLQCFRQAARSCFNFSKFHLLHSQFYIHNWNWLSRLSEFFVLSDWSFFSFSTHFQVLQRFVLIRKMQFYCVTIVFLPSVSTAIQTNLGARKTSNIRACSLQSPVCTLILGKTSQRK